MKSLLEKKDLSRRNVIFKVRITLFKQMRKQKSRKM